jgi:hypothetical protein
VTLLALIALLPYITLLALVFTVVFALPSTVHGLDKAAPANAPAAWSEEDIAKAMNAEGEQSEAQAPR